MKEVNEFFFPTSYPQGYPYLLAGKFSKGTWRIEGMPGKSPVQAINKEYSSLFYFVVVIFLSSVWAVPFLYLNDKSESCEAVRLVRVRCEGGVSCGNCIRTGHGFFTVFPLLVTSLKLLSPSAVSRTLDRYTYLPFSIFTCDGLPVRQPVGLCVLSVRRPTGCCVGIRCEGTWY